eukprot:TRINITY_DN3673_c0_g2_i1.p1 TRINITY_DN3673_c0_g2~~TRINITY_DN3673_c0_g2_i1.p1  ORF type:complete len:538 (+),score=87.37 TRINITY_DN3673_c0_g2_i1:152-1765(+)
MTLLGWVTALVGPHETLKVVRFRSIKLSVMYKGFLVLVLSYVLGYQCLYSNRHMVKSRPNGVGRLQLQRPTKDHCNPNHPNCEADFTPLKDLPYCDVYSGPKSLKAVGPGMPCKYFDEKMMNPSGKTDESLLIPTRTTQTKQSATENCATDTKKTCANVYEFTQAESETVYVADIERFTLLIDHAFMVPFEDRELGAPIAGGASSLYKGFFEVCVDPGQRLGCRAVEIPCVSGCDVQSEASAKRRLAAEDASTTDDVVDDKTLLAAEPYKPSFFSIKVGDVIPMGELLRLAGINLNTDKNEFGESRRYEGSVLQIDIDYTNTKPFQWPPWKPGPISYVYRVSLLPMGTFKEVSEKHALGDTDRMLLDWHGIFVRVSLTGSISYFSLAQFILVMTASVGLLALADTFVHQVALRCTSSFESREYERYKYDSSIDFDKGTLFEQGLNSIDSKAWSKYEGDGGTEAFIDDFKSNDGETVAMAAHVIMELYKRHHERDSVSKLVHERSRQGIEDSNASGSLPDGYAPVGSAELRSDRTQGP